MRRRNPGAGKTDWHLVFQYNNKSGMPERAPAPTSSCRAQAVVVESLSEFLCTASVFARNTGVGKPKWSNRHCMEMSNLDGYLTWEMFEISCSDFQVIYYGVCLRHRSNSNL